MDASFEMTVGGGAGWGDMDSTNTQVPISSNVFDRVPLPVRIDDLLASNSEDDKLHIGNYSFGTLRVCGRILKKEEKEKETRIEICDPAEKDYDSCSKLNVVVYQSAQGNSSYAENDIVIALGKMRKYGGTVSMVAFGLVVQSDPRAAEVFKLETELAHRYYSIGVPERISQNECPEYEGTILSNLPINRGNNPNTTNATKTNAQDAVFGMNSNFASKSEFTSMSADVNRGLTGLKEKIYCTIRDTAIDADTGVHIADVRRAVGQNSEAFDIELQYLVNEGVIYNTIDDDHFSAI